MLRAHLEDLQQCWSNVVLGVQPRQRVIRVEGSLPDEAAIVLQLHLEKWIGQRGEVVVVDAGVSEGGGDADLPHIILDGKLLSPEGKRPPVFAERRVVRHRAVDEVRDAGLLRSVRTCLADRHFIGPMDGVDESDLGTREQSGQQTTASRGVGQISFDELYVGESGQLIRNNTLLRADLSPDMPADRCGGANERRRLSTGRVDGHDGLTRHDTCWVNQRASTRDSVSEARIRRRCWRGPGLRRTEWDGKGPLRSRKSEKRS
nr:hypothetical protein CFP56_29849 [Quercus suber]